MKSFSNFNNEYLIKISHHNLLCKLGGVLVFSVGLFFLGIIVLKNKVHNLPISDFIGKGEGSYNSVNLGKRYGYKSDTRDITSMKLSEVRAMQGRFEVNAVGKYQIIRDTMPDVVEGMQLTGEEKFDKDMQDKMGAWLFYNKRELLGGYVKGKHNDRFKAGDDGAREWASLPVLSETLKTSVGNKTFYSKRGATAYSDGINKAQHSAKSYEKSLDNARAMYAKLIASGINEDEAELMAFKGFYKDNLEIKNKNY